MHFHHRHDVDGCVDAHTEWPEPYRVILATLDRLESHVSTQQTSIDAAVAVLGDLVAEVGSLKASLAAKAIDTVDTAPLDAAVAAAKAALEALPAADPAAPVDPAPAAPVADPINGEAPAAPVEPAPVVTEPAPADSTVIA